jgi:hypothetical protein
MTDGGRRGKQHLPANGALVATTLPEPNVVCETTISDDVSTAAFVDLGRDLTIPDCEIGVWIATD